MRKLGHQENFFKSSPLIFFFFLVMDNKKPRWCREHCLGITVNRDMDPESYDLGLDVSLIVTQFLAYDPYWKYLSNLDVYL